MRKVVVPVLALAAGFAGGLSVALPQILAAQAAGGSSETYRQLNLFGDVFERVRSDYVVEPNDGELIESAVNGMLTALDPHSSYMSPKSFRDMQVQTRGEFGGLGIEVTMDNGVVKVVTPIDDTPAAKAGILAGDLITHLDDEPVQGMTLAKAVERMRGEVDTSIRLTVIRKGREEPLTITIVRAVIQIRSVRSRVEDDVAYLRITTFNEKAFDGIKEEVAKLEEKIGKDKLKGFILDLRNNPGGLLDQAIAVSDAFLDRGEIVSTRGRAEDDIQRYNARKGDLTGNRNLIVLINGGSASASEIVAGALQDHRRATILGTRSFGKGSVQTIIPLGVNGAIRLTTARYYTPAGCSIQARGIHPDIFVEQELPEDLKSAPATERPRGEEALPGHLENLGECEDNSDQTVSTAYVPPDPKDDKQLAYALDLLRGVKTDKEFPPNPKAAVAN